MNIRMDMIKYPESSSFWRPVLHDPQPLNPNATPVLDVRDWHEIHRMVERVSINRMPATTKLLSMGLRYPFPGAQELAEPALSQLTKSAAGTFVMTKLPLPWIHQDTPYNKSNFLTHLEAAFRNVCNRQEEVLLGLGEIVPDLRGFCNHEDRNTRVTSPKSLFVDVLRMKQDMMNMLYYGPYLLFCGHWWDRFLDDDSVRLPSKTLAEEVAEIEGIACKPIICEAFKSDDKSFVMVHGTTDVVRLVTTLSPTVIQTDDKVVRDEKGNEIQRNMNFKSVTGITPQIRKSWSGNLGIIHATVSAL